jgi:type II secretory pathway component PulK
MVLILVIILLGLVTALVVQSQLSARAALRSAEHQLRAARLRAALTDAARLALERIADDKTEWDHPDEPWAQAREISTPDGVSLWIKPVDENAFFDLNNLYMESASQTMRPAQEIVMDLLTLCSDFTPITRVQALVDWIDPDSEGFREAAFYAEKDPPYEPPNTWLSTRAELPLVEGFSRDYLRRRGRQDIKNPFEADVLDCVTVIPDRRSSPIPVNVNTAPRAVLLGVAGLEYEQWVQYILVLREEGPLVSLDSVFAAAPEELESLVRPYLGISSAYFRVEVRGYLEGLSRELFVLARRRSEGDVEVLRWVFSKEDRES